jgi:UDP-N-acetylglucosamine--N-acetylmuramyl-(pentapeptide) pyrophosphoryl-undecaprenol N-acetylglucosamine transferase
VPALAVVEQLAIRQPGSRVVFACSNRPIDRTVLAGGEHAAMAQPVVPMPRGPRGWLRFGRSWLASRALARDLVGDLRPAAVLGTGGFASAPVVREASRRKRPVGVLNPDAHVGLANRLLVRRADRVFVQFEEALRRLPASARDRGRSVGCPIRPMADVSPGEAREHFGLSADRRTLLVLGGSQGARSVNQAIERLLGAWAPQADRWQVLHITGPGYDKADAPRAGGVSVRRVSFCHEMDWAYRSASLALCRAGAVTVAELMASRTPAVLMPYPHHRDDHQRLNAEQMVSTGGAVIVTDRVEPAANAEALAEAMGPLWGDDTALEAMRRRLSALPANRAAEVVADWLIEAGGGG